MSRPMPRRSRSSRCRVVSSRSDSKRQMPEPALGSDMLEDFEAAEVESGETRIFIRSGGAGPPVLLLHGFPQTHLMWRSVAPLLARHFTVVCPDLRGYGRSGCPASTPDHAPYAKRAMAHDMVAVMARLGVEHFSG